MAPTPESASAAPPSSPRRNNSVPNLVRHASGSSGPRPNLWSRFFGADTDEPDDDVYRIERPTVSGHKLSDRELHFDERIRTTCLVIIAAAVVYAAMNMLESIIIPFIIALAIKYLLAPLIEWLSCGSPSARRRCFCRLPRGIAVVLSFLFAICVLVSLGIVIGHSVEIFTERSGQYRERVEAILEAAFNSIEDAQIYMSNAQQDTMNKIPYVHVQRDASREEGARQNLEVVRDQVLDFMKQVSLTDLILSLLGKAAHVAEDLMYIVLFLVFMLAHSESSVDERPDAFARTIDRQIFVYIRGKTSISAFVAITNGSILWAVGLDLFLAFGVLAFFLNFIPNVGMFTSVILPMPLIALDPTFTTLQIVLAFAGPLTVGMFAKDVLEPVILGHGTSLHPVCVLLAIMLFGSVWGVTGMVMAVPLTAVLRIYLEAVDHPLPRYIAQVLAGRRTSRELSHSRTELV